MDTFELLPIAHLCEEFLELNDPYESYFCEPDDSGESYSLFLLKREEVRSFMNTATLSPSTM